MLMNNNNPHDGAMVKKEAEKLGIIAIESDAPLSVDILRDAITVIKAANIDFQKVAKQAACERLKAKYL